MKYSMRHRAFFLGAVYASFLVACSSSQQHERLVRNSQELALSALLKAPQKHLSKNLKITGLVDSVSIQESQDKLSILNIYLLAPEEHDRKNQLLARSPMSFLEKFQRLGQDFAFQNQAKISSKNDINTITRLAYNLEIAAGELKIEKLRRPKEQQNIYHNFSLAYKNLAYAYFDVVSILKKQKNNPTHEITLLDNELGQSALRLKKQMAKNYITLDKGLYPFEHQSQEFGFLLDRLQSLSLENKNLSLKFKREKQIEASQEAELLASSFTKVHQAFKLIDTALSQIAQSSKKTAIINLEKLQRLRCTYYGFNNSHLNRCKELIRNLKPGQKISLTGSLYRSNLREEINVLWLNAGYLEVDDLEISLNYGDESNFIRRTRKFYEWADGF